MVTREREFNEFFSHNILPLSAGFAFLPFLWLVNACWFFKYAFKAPDFPEQKKIRSCKYIIIIYTLFIGNNAPERHQSHLFGAAPYWLGQGKLGSMC